MRNIRKEIVFRAPEVAMGDHLSVLRTANQDRRAALLARLQGIPDLAAADTELLMNDFDLSSLRLVASIEMKTSFTGALPFALCGCAVADEVVARKHMGTLLLQFDSNPYPRAHDRVTSAYCEPGRIGGLRKDIDDWVQTGISGERFGCTSRLFVSSHFWKGEQRNHIGMSRLS